MGSGIRSAGQSHSSEASTQSLMRLHRADSGTQSPLAHGYSPYLQPGEGTYVNISCCDFKVNLG